MMRWIEGFCYQNRRLPRELGSLHRPARGMMNEGDLSGNRVRLPSALTPDPGDWSTAPGSDLCVGCSCNGGHDDCSA